MRNMQEKWRNFPNRFGMLLFGAVVVGCPVAVSGAQENPVPLHQAIEEHYPLVSRIQVTSSEVTENSIPAEPSDSMEPSISTPSSHVERHATRPLFNGTRRVYGSGCYLHD